MKATERYDIFHVNQKQMPVLTISKANPGENGTEISVKFHPVKSVIFCCLTEIS